MLDKYVDYDDQEVYYEVERDPREVNVVERLKNIEKIKAELPKVNDDHVCVQVLETELARVKEELAMMKFDKVLSEGGDITLSGSLSFSETNQVTTPVSINLAGQNIVLGKSEVGDGIFCVPAGGSLTIQGNGKVEVSEQADDGYAMAIWANGGDVIINGGTFLNDSISGTDNQYDLIYAKNGSTITIKGGIFKSKTPKWTLNKHDSTDGKIIVEGGTFFEYDPSASATENPVGNFVAEGYTVISEIKEDGTWYTVVPA